MKFSEYQEKARNTAIYPKEQGLYYTTLGLVGEAGEIANKVKKVIRDDAGDLTDEARAVIVNEIGDALWYIANLAFELGIELDMIAHQNLRKLSARQEGKTLKGSGDDREQIKDIASLMSQSILKKGDVVHAFNNYIVKSKSYGKAILIEQKSVSQSLYHGYHPELWIVDINGKILDVWVLPQDKIESAKQEEVALNDEVEQTETPEEEQSPEEAQRVEDTPTEEAQPSSEEEEALDEAEDETAAAEEEAAPAPVPEESEPEKSEEEKSTTIDAPSEEKETPSESTKEETAPETETSSEEE